MPPPTSQYLQIVKMILDCIVKVQAGMDQKERVVFTESSDLLGGQSPLDSVNLVSVIIDLEEALQDKFKRPIALADERAMSQKDYAFGSVRSLATYIDLLLTEKH